MFDLDAIEAACERSVHDGVCVSGNVLQCMTAIPDLTRRIREQEAELAHLQSLFNLVGMAAVAAVNDLRDVTTVERARRIGDMLRDVLELEGNTTCYSCEVCGHARTTRECLRCEVEKLRALCGEAADAIRTLEDTPHYIATEYESLRARLRAASKGEL